MIDGHLLQSLAACISHILLLKLLLMRQGVSHLGWVVRSNGAVAFLVRLKVRVGA